MPSKRKAKVKPQDSPEVAAKKAEQYKVVEEIYASIKDDIKKIEPSLKKLIETREEVLAILKERNPKISRALPRLQRNPDYAKLTAMISEDSKFILTLQDWEKEFRKEWKEVKKQDVETREEFICEKERIISGLVRDYDIKAQSGFAQVGVVAPENGKDWGDAEYVEKRKKYEDKCDEDKKKKKQEHEQKKKKEREEDVKKKEAKEREMREDRRGSVGSLASGSQPQGTKLPDLTPDFKKKLCLFLDLPYKR